MSWQATAWAAKQVTGSASNKLTLLALANYADAEGICWPTQEQLAADTEQSVDTVQRRTKALVALGIIRIEKRTLPRGKWAGRIYILNMGVAEMSKPQVAARSKRADYAAPSPSTTPHQARPPCRTAVRYEPSIEQPIKQPRQTQPLRRAESQSASQKERQGVEVIQNRIAQRLGPDGWEILLRLDERELHRLTSQERAGTLDDAALARLRFDVMHAQPP